MHYFLVLSVLLHSFFLVLCFHQITVYRMNFLVVSWFHNHRWPLLFHVPVFVLLWQFTGVSYKLLFIMEGIWGLLHIKWLSSCCAVSIRELWWEDKEVLLLKIKCIRDPRTCIDMCYWARWHNILGGCIKNSWCPAVVCQVPATCLHQVSARWCVGRNVTNSVPNHLCVHCKNRIGYLSLSVIGTNWNLLG